jgi:succinate-semialdehyde dehydrogenase / glutarate-semialdehyde dehydrogenase
VLAAGDRPTLADGELWRDGLYIDGAWTASSDNAQIPVIDPATGSAVASVADATRADAERALRAAEVAFSGWAARPAKDRASVLRRWHDLILAGVEDLAAILVCEQGKPLQEAREEIRYGAAYVEWFAEEAKRAYGEIVPTNVSGRRTSVLRQPIGVCAAITPWNFPAAMILRKAAPALACGCTMVLKPASQTPLSALALAELAHRAELPRGVLNVVHGPPQLIAGAMLEAPSVRKLTFTGSARVGKLLMSRCAETVKRVSLELGGNAPFIVFADADIDQALSGLIKSKFRNSGQTCISANRVLVHSSLHDAFVERLAAAAGELRVGPGSRAGVQQGPLIDEAAVEKVQSLVDDAVAGGARIAAGGGSHPLGGTFFSPTVLTGVTPSMRVAREEIFGPVAPVISFDSEAEAIEMANDTEAGLAAYFYTSSAGRVTRVSEALRFGMVGINTGVIAHEGAPFGGFGQAGLGREGSRHGLDGFLELKYLCLEGI